MNQDRTCWIPNIFCLQITVGNNFQFLTLLPSFCLKHHLAQSILLTKPAPTKELSYTLLPITRLLLLGFSQISFKTPDYEKLLNVAAVINLYIETEEEGKKARPQREELSNLDARASPLALAIFDFF